MTVRCVSVASNRNPPLSSFESKPDRWATAELRDPPSPCKESGTGRIRAGGVERDVTFAEAADDVDTDIDAW
jgi:hypothetical protein